MANAFSFFYKALYGVLILELYTKNIQQMCILNEIFSEIKPYINRRKLECRTL